VAAYLSILAAHCRLFFLWQNKNPGSPVFIAVSAATNAGLIVLASDVLNPNPNPWYHTIALLFVQILTSVGQINQVNHTPMSFLMRGPSHGLTVQPGSQHILFLLLGYVLAAVVGKCLSVRLSPEFALQVGFRKTQGVRIGGEDGSLVAGNVALLVLVVAPLFFATRSLV
jgi:hypothetical protein